MLIVKESNQECDRFISWREHFLRFYADVCKTVVVVVVVVVVVRRVVRSECCNVATVLCVYF